jgi:hypothetical protein
VAEEDILTAVSFGRAYKLDAGENLDQSAHFKVPASRIRDFALLSRPVMRETD